MRLLRDRYRLLDEDQIQALFPRNTRSWKRRLYGMFHNGLTSRPPRFQDHIAGHRPMVHGLGNAGADLLAKIDGVERENTNWQRRNREIGSDKIEHILMASSVGVALTVATTQAEGVELGHWQPEGDPLNAKVAINGEGLPIRPDGFFTLGLFGQPRPFRHFALEADRSTMAHKRFFSKLRAYWGGRRQYAEFLNINNFQVLVVCLTRERAENLRKLAWQTDQRAQGSQMFLFGSAEDFSVTNPKILEPIWTCGRRNCDKLHSLIE